MYRALYFEKLEDNLVRCTLCPRECVIKPGNRGFCRAKENHAGELYSTIYAEVSSSAIDPIEKKPLYHFCPGSTILSIGTIGCNLRCKFCQNWHIAHIQAPTRRRSGRELVNEALHNDTIGIAYTYSEPLIWYEYILDTSKKVKEAGLKNVLVTNGLIHRKPLEELLSYIDGVNLDIKAFTEKFYDEVCGGKDYFNYVKETAKVVSKACHLEVTTLLIPGLNDDPDELQELAYWLAELNPDIPLHLNRYFPNYQMDLSPTTVESMLMAKEIAEEYLHYVYLGNVADADRTTYCSECHYPVVKRDWFVEVDLNGECCPECGTVISLILS